MDIKNHQKYLVIILFIILITLTFLILKSFLLDIVWACFLAYFFYPVYNLINKKIKQKTVSAAIMCILLIILILLPLSFIVTSLINQSINLYNHVKGTDISSLISSLIPNYNISNLTMYIEEAVKKVSSLIFDAASKFLFTIPKRILDLFITFFILFYLFKSGNSLIKTIENLIPSKPREKIINEFKNVTHAIIYGQFLTAIIQGFVATIGFIIFKVPNPILWGAIMILLAMLPFLGPAFIWVPASILLYLSGNLYSAIGLFIYGVLIISTIDNIVKPKIIGRRAKVHPVIILLGIVGGLSFFGIIGIILGPLILVFLITMLKFYGILKNGT